jgi:serine/threonine protein kinase
LDNINNIKRANDNSRQGTKMRSQRQTLKNVKNRESGGSLIISKSRYSNTILKNNSVLEKQIKVQGTPDYIAPEMINGNVKNEKCLDWWALGCLIYEFVIGIPPFHDETGKAIFDNIINFTDGIYEIQWPDPEQYPDIPSHVCKDLIMRLLNPDPNNRIGAKSVWEIKNHPFFAEVDWTVLKQLIPPFADHKG